MKILVTGGRGQLGRAMVRRGTERRHVIAALDLPELDICDRAAVDQQIAALRPTFVVNAAAYTAVDKAEAERERAFAVNEGGARNVAHACRDAGVPLVHISTDYVFDGSAARPYREDDPIAPLGVYGASKAAGERAVIETGASIIRTSWLFGQGGPSFVHTMLRLAAERPVLRIVGDQHGCPTWTDDLADAIIALAERRTEPCVLHFCNAGETNVARLRDRDRREARKHKQLACDRIDAITTAEYPTPAKRPAYSVLATERIAALGIVPPPWQRGLAEVVMQELS